MRKGTAATLTALALASGSLAACGSATAPYVPLTAANLASTMSAAIKDKHSVHEVATSGTTTSTLDVDFSGPTRSKMVISGSSNGTLIVIGPDLYLSFPGRTPAGKWLKYPASSVGALTSALVNFNPVNLVNQFNKGIQKVTYVGPATVGGDPVERYDVSLSAAKLLAALGQSAGSADLGADTTITETIYLNTDNTLRRFVLTMPAGVGNTEIDVTNWGVPVTITPPPASQVEAAPKK